jgi:hypothetical protein
VLPSCAAVRFLRSVSEQAVLFGPHMQPIPARAHLMGRQSHPMRLPSDPAPYPPHDCDFCRCQKRFGTANPLDEGSSDEEDTEMAKSDTYMGMNKLLRAINDTVERGAPPSNP